MRFDEKSMKIKKEKKNKKEKKEKKRKITSPTSKKKKSPYIFTIHKMKESDTLIKDPSLLHYSREYSPLSGSELKYDSKEVER